MRIDTIVHNFCDFSCHFVTFITFMYSNGQFQTISHSKIKPGVKRAHSRYSYTKESVIPHARHTSLIYVQENEELCRLRLIASSLRVKTVVAIFVLSRAREQTKFDDDFVKLWNPNLNFNFFHVI